MYKIGDVVRVKEQTGWDDIDYGDIVRIVGICVEGQADYEVIHITNNRGLLNELSCVIEPWIMDYNIYKTLSELYKGDEL